MNRYYAGQDYPVKIRRIKYLDIESGKVFIFLTNNFELAATDSAKLYNHRWLIELFLKWFKQHLKVKSFCGHSENAVKNAKKKSLLNQSLYEILKVLSIRIFEKVPINQLFQQTQQQYFKD